MVPLTNVLAGSTPAHNAGTGANATGVGTIAWTAPGNITAVGTPYATAILTNTATSNYLEGTNYGFAIPASATINGITVTINRMSNSSLGGNSINDVTVQLLKGGALVGNNKATVTDWPTALGTANYGGTSDLWGTTWTPEEINASNFGVALAAVNQSTNNRTATVDYMQITVTYTVPGSVAGQFPHAGADAAGVGTVVWSNPGNITANDANNATASGGVQTHYLEGTDFQFNIPTDATVSGIAVTIGRFGTTGGGADVRDAVVSLIKNGTVVTGTGSNLAATGTDWPATITAANYGGDTELWGTAWTPADINASNFGVALSATLNTRTASVDYITVTVSYSQPAATTLTVATATGSYGGTVNLSATLLRGAVPVVGKTVNFTLNGSSAGSGITNASGVATVTGAGLSGIDGGSYPTGVGASFAGDSDYAASSGSNTLTVNKIDQTISFGTLSDKTYGDVNFAVTASASSTLPVSFSTTTTDVCTVTADGTVVHLVGVGTCTIDADQAGDTNYNAAPRVSQGFNVAKADQTISFGALADKTFGDADFPVSATASSTLPVSFSTTTTGVCTVTSDGLTVHLAAAGTCTIDADQAGDANYNAAPRVSQSFTVNKDDQTIDFGPLADKTFGDANFSVSATASSDLPVIFSSATTSICTVTSDGLTVELLAAGTCTLDADQPGDGNYNAATQVPQSFTVNKADQTITFGLLSDKTYGDLDFSVTATSSSGLPVSFSTATTSVCTVTADGLTVHLAGAGDCTIDADQAGSSDYNAAVRVSQGFTVQKADQIISFGTLSDKTYGDADFAVSATADSGLAVSFSTTTTSVCTVTSDGLTVHLVGGGTCTIDADQAGDGNYNAALRVSQGFTVLKADQTITFGTLADKTYGDADFSVSATASSTLPVSFSTATTSVCTVTADGSVVHLVGGGTCTIDADQGGDTNYNAALQASQSFNVGKASQTISFGTLTDKVFGDADFSVTATASSGLAVSFSTATTSVCTVTSDGVTVHLVGAGTCIIDADQAGDTNYSAALQVPQSFNVGKANQTINFGTLSSKVLGDPDFAVTATATSGLPVSFSTTTASVCTVSSDGTVVHLAALGTCAIDADQAGDTNYNAAVRVSQSFDVLVAPAPVFTADPTSWGFGIVKNGTSSAAKVFTITNTGTADLVFNGAVTLGGTDAGQFLLSADTCSNATLAATTGACSITATFKPTIKGLKNATISFPDNAAGNPHTIALTGTGGAELLWNGGFNVYVGTTTKIPRYWQAMNFASTDGKSTTIKQEGPASVRMGNTSAVTKTLTETRMITGPAGTTFQLSVWAKGQKVPTTAGMARVVVQFYNGTKLVQTKFINMPTGTYAFTQKKTAVFSTTQSYTKVVIKLIYSKGSGAIWFDGLSLMRLK